MFLKQLCISLVKVPTFRDYELCPLFPHFPIEFEGDLIYYDDSTVPPTKLPQSRNISIGSFREYMKGRSTGGYIGYISNAIKAILILILLKVDG